MFTVDYFVSVLNTFLCGAIHAQEKVFLRKLQKTLLIMFPREIPMFNL